MERYKPYAMEAWKTLMQRAYDLGWYGGVQDLLTVTMKGAFEGWSGRASENWENRFYVTFRKPIRGGRNEIPEEVYKADAPTLEEACSKILQQLAIKRQEKKRNVEYGGSSGDSAGD